jgi:exopolysaccharide production protein ExoZ
VTRIAVMAVGFLALIALNSSGTIDWAPVNFLGDGILSEFLMGCLAGYLYRENLLARIHPSVSILAIGAAVSALVFFGSYDSGIHRAIISGIPGFVLVCSVLALEENGRVATLPFWKYLGDASYSLYVTHLSVIVLLRTIWSKAALPTHGLMPALSFTALSLALAVPVALATYTFVERPLLKALRSRFQGLRGERAAVKWPPPVGQPGPVS